MPHPDKWMFSEVVQVVYHLGKGDIVTESYYDALMEMKEGSIIQLPKMDLVVCRSHLKQHGIWGVWVQQNTFSGKIRTIAIYSPPAIRAVRVPSACNKLKESSDFITRL